MNPQIIPEANSLENISASERNLRILVNNINDPIWLVDHNLKIVECNKSFKKWVYNFIGRELNPGDNVLYYGINKSYLEKFEMCYKLALGGSSFQSVEDIIIDGETKYTVVNFNPVSDINGLVNGVSCSARDITEQRMHLYKIEAQNKALREIAFMESHKLRGPLANMICIRELFNDNDPSDPVNRELMEGVGKMCHELDKIVREVVEKTNEV